MNSRLARSMAIFGRRVTGLTARTDTIGCQGYGWRRRASACFGRRAIGDSQADFTRGIPDFGDRTLVSMAALTTASAISAPGSSAALGRADTSAITLRYGPQTPASCATYISIAR